MKTKSKFISLSLVFIFMFLIVGQSVFYVYAEDFKDVEIKEQITDLKKEIKDGERISFPWKYVFKVAKWLVVKGDNSLFYREPATIDKGGNWTASSSGSVAFGSGNAQRVKFVTDVRHRHNHLDVFAQTSVTGWMNKISIFIEDGSGDQVYGNQVTHNQHIFTSYDLPLDTYEIYYVYSGNKKWDCWIYRYDFREDNRSNSRNSADETKEMVYNPKLNKSYIIPSDINKQITPITNNKNVVLTGQQLVDEFFDEQLNCSVNRLKNYDVGDEIFVKDVIVDLKYNEKEDKTTLYFANTSDGPFEWYFKGDIRDSFSIGDEIQFKFKVVEEFSNNKYTFETLDFFMDSYNLDVNRGETPDIETYLY